jgi:hypothetical protein
MIKKVYQNRGEKLFDFFIGFFVLPLSFTIISFLLASLLSLIGYYYLSGIIATIIFIFSLFTLIYLLIKRKYMGLGLLFATIVVPLVLVGTCLLIFAGGSLIGKIFGH